jgi:hypothetical protein
VCAPLLLQHWPEAWVPGGDNKFFEKVQIDSGVTIADTWWVQYAYEGSRAQTDIVFLLFPALAVAADLLG